MLIWWPKIKDLAIPVPRTEFVPISRADLAPVTMDGEEIPESVQKSISEVEQVADSFGYPVLCEQTFLQANIAGKTPASFRTAKQSKEI